MEEHHRFLLGTQLHRLSTVEKDLAIVEQRIQEKLKPYSAEVTLLDEIPGVDTALAGAIIAELGVDMSVFENVSQLASWAGFCPGNNESAGKSRSSRIPKGNVYLKTALVEAANAAAEAKGTYLRDKILPTQGSTRLQARRSSDSPQDLSSHLPHAFPPGLLQRSRRSLPRQTKQTSPDSKPRSSPGTPRLYRHTRAEGCLKSSPAELYFHSSGLTRTYPI
jgi:hypothetical protein